MVTGRKGSGEQKIISAFSQSRELGTLLLFSAAGIVLGMKRNQDRWTILPCRLGEEIRMRYFSIMMSLLGSLSINIVLELLAQAKTWSGPTCTKAGRRNFQSARIVI